MRGASPQPRARAQHWDGALGSGCSCAAPGGQRGPSRPEPLLSPGSHAMAAEMWEHRSAGSIIPPLRAKGTPQRTGNCHMRDNVCHGFRTSREEKNSFSPRNTIIHTFCIPGITSRVTGAARLQHRHSTAVCPGSFTLTYSTHSKTQSSAPASH